VDFPVEAQLKVAHGTKLVLGLTTGVGVCLRRRRYAAGRRTHDASGWRTLAVWRDQVARVTVFGLSPDTEYAFSVSASRRHRADDDQPSDSAVMHSPTVVAKTSPAGTTPPVLH